MNTIIIGVINDDNLSQQAAQHNKAQLESLHFIVEIITFQALEAAEKALLCGDIDLLTRPLSELPTILPEGLVITALSERKTVGDCLLIRQEVIDNQLFSFKLGARVGVSSARQQAQLLQFRPDVKSVETTDIQGLTQLIEGKLEVLMLSKSMLSTISLDLSAFKIVALHPREFVPAAGQGVFAHIVNANNKALRTQLKAIHNTDVAAVTNIERSVLKMLRNNTNLALGIYCERDAMHYYHSWVAVAENRAAPVHRIRLSSSTSHGVTDDILEAIKNKILIQL